MLGIQGAPVWQTTVLLANHSDHTLVKMHKSASVYVRTL